MCPQCEFPVSLDHVLTKGFVQHPITAAAAGVLYVFGRIAYFWGYATGTPSRRMTGGPMYGAGFMTLLVICIKSVVELVISKLN